MPLFKEAPPKVLVPEKLSADGLALLRGSLDVDERKGLTPEELLEIIPNYDALLVRSETKVTATVLQAARRLKVVARAGVGVDNVGQSSPRKGCTWEIKGEFLLSSVLQMSPRLPSWESSWSTHPPATLELLLNIPSH